MNNMKKTIISDTLRNYHNTITKNSKNLIKYGKISEERNHSTRLSYQGTRETVYSLIYSSMSKWLKNKSHKFQILMQTF